MSLNDDINIEKLKEKIDSILKVELKEAEKKVQEIKGRIEKIKNLKND